MKALLTLILLTLILSGLPPVARCDTLPADALQAATDFLASYDQGDWIGCWQNASEEFRQSQPLEQWIDASNRRENLLGPAVSRTLLKTTPLQRLSNFPDGDYLAILFQLQTTRKQKASELVVVGQQNGHWQVTLFRRL